MHGRHDIIEFDEDVVLKIEPAIAENVAFDPGEEPKIVEFAIELSDRSDLRSQPGGIEPSRGLVLDRVA